MELLVVISIIGLLSSFAVVSLNTARAKARDALRKGDMAQLRTAMNLYYDDHNGYPASNPRCTWVAAAPHGATFDQDGADCYSEVGTDPATSLSEALVASTTRQYLGSMPKDPRNTGNTAATNEYFYRYVSDGRDYAIIYRLEEQPGVDQVMRGW